MSKLDLKMMLDEYIMTGNVRGYLAAVCFAYDQLNKSQALEELCQSVIL